MKFLQHQYPFLLECGAVLPELDIAYCTYGKLNKAKNNVIWIFHALTGSADAADWWSGLVGEGKVFDPKIHFIVCANVLGSSYGATSPKSIHPETGKPYGNQFPLITIKDVVKSHQILQKYLGIQQILLGIGGSMGGQQALEWAILDKNLFKNTCIIAANAQHSPWGIALNEAQRMALEADPTFFTDAPDAGAKGLEAARAIGMISYRSYFTYQKTQTDTDERADDFKASSYQRYQGKKLVQRFDAKCYFSLSKTMDSQHVGRERGGILAALKGVTARTLVVGIQSDLLFPVAEQQFLAKNIPNATLRIIDSPYGHDGFLIEWEQLTCILTDFLKENSSKNLSKNSPISVRRDAIA
jgi:homoserine O-acetyltransferase/O-succinyltransferase